MSTYFKYIDQDYRDLKKFWVWIRYRLQFSPAETFEAYEKRQAKRYIR